MGYPDSEQEVYRWAYSITPAVDPEEVEALLFQKSTPEVNDRGTFEYKEENLYIVPLE